MGHKLLLIGQHEEMQGVNLFAGATLSAQAGAFYELQLLPVGNLIYYC